jgi:hypothetical protein
MNGLFRFIAKLFGGGRARPAETSPSESLRPTEPRVAEALALGPSAPPTQAPRAPEPGPEPGIVLLELTEDEDVADDPEDESDELDPTLGRYEELQVEILDADLIDAQRTAAQAEGLAGPHKIFPHDPAGPGSLAETLARLEVEGLVTSRVCDDAESGFYVLYEPAPKA